MRNLPRASSSIQAVSLTGSARKLAGGDADQNACQDITRDIASGICQLPKSRFLGWVCALLDGLSECGHELGHHVVTVGVQTSEEVCLAGNGTNTDGPPHTCAASTSPLRSSADTASLTCVGSSPVTDASSSTPGTGEPWSIIRAASRSGPLDGPRPHPYLVLVRRGTEPELDGAFGPGDRETRHQLFHAVFPQDPSADARRDSWGADRELAQLLGLQAPGLP